MVHRSSAFPQSSMTSTATPSMAQAEYSSMMFGWPAQICKACASRAKDKADASPYACKRSEAWQSVLGPILTTYAATRLKYLEG